MSPEDTEGSSDPATGSIYQSPITPTKTKGLGNRSSNAIQYTKSQLNEGDTLVIVRFPNNQQVYDTAGFQLTDTHRAHSDRLKAASPVFKKALEDEWQQHRFKRRNKLLGHLPDGIQYVLDLTPPEEGDDALELTAELSCSLGIRRWYKSEFSTVATAHGLVGGQDETTIHPELKSGSLSPKEVQEIIDAEAPKTTQNLKWLVDKDADADLQRTLVQSMNLCERKTSQQSDGKRNYNQDGKEIETLDYCPIRHRTGIERLLQIIEGKDPRLDSAPKVWTLVVLAKHFECPHSVVDYVVTWMIAEPNCKIFEILPEDCLRIGMMLQNEVVTRYAFTILVSEEALRVSTARFDSANHPNTSIPARKHVTKLGRAREALDEDTLNLIQHAGRNFHARIEQEFQLLLSPKMNWLHSLPEFAKILKIKDFIEANAKSYHHKDEIAINTAIDETVYYIRGRLLSCFYRPLDESEGRSWNDHRIQDRHYKSITDKDYNELAEHEKLMTRVFWAAMRLLKWAPGDYRCNTNLIRDQAAPTWPPAYATLALEAKALEAADFHRIPKIFMHRLEATVDRLNEVILKSILEMDFNDGQFPRESFMVEQIQRPAMALEEEDLDQGTDFWKLFDRPMAPSGSLTEPNVETPGFWKEALKARDEAIIGEGSSRNALSTGPEINNDNPESRLDNVEKVSKTAIAEVEKEPLHEQSSLTAPATRISAGTEFSSASQASRPIQEKPDSPVLTRTDDFYQKSKPRVPTDREITPSSPFFSLATLFTQIDFHMQTVCNRMLSRGEVQNLRPPTCDICDTLLCLGEDEYKYLPLWASGLNDGTGGVFEDAIPSAERGAAMGPGTAYHTGSTVNSRASTEIKFDGRSSVFGSADTSKAGVNTSVGVEDGWSVDHEFMTPAASEDGSMVFVGANADEEMLMNLPITEEEKGIDFGAGDAERSGIPVFVTNEIEPAALLASSVGKRKRTERDVGEQMMGVTSSSDPRAMGGKSTVNIDDDENFFNTADDNTEFEFDSDDEGDETETETETETEDDFEHID